MKRYRIEATVIDQWDGEPDTEEELGEYVQESLEEGLGVEFKVEGLSVYEIML